jgi:hypothetical protein
MGIKIFELYHTRLHTHTKVIYNPFSMVSCSEKISQIRSFEHIIVRIIGFNQAELFFGFLEHPIPNPNVHRLTLKSKSLSGECYKTIHKLCNIKLPKNAILDCRSSKKAYELKSELFNIKK